MALILAECGPEEISQVVEFSAVQHFGERPPSVANQMLLAAEFGPVGGIRAGLRPRIRWNFWNSKEPEAQLYKSARAEASGDAHKQRGRGPEARFSVGFPALQENDLTRSLRHFALAHSSGPTRSPAGLDRSRLDAPLGKLHLASHSTRPADCRRPAG